jgi:PAS domain S-box-containing protein
MIRGPAGRCRIDAIEPEVAEFQRIDKHIDRANRIALVDPIIKAFRQQRRLLAIRPLNETPHHPPAIQQGNHSIDRVFTRPGPKPDLTALQRMAAVLSNRPARNKIGAAMLRSMARTYGLRRSEMAESINISRLRGPSTLLRYGLAVLAVSAATIIQQFGDKHFAVTPSYFCAVLLTAWLGGLGPALLAIALSNLALMYYFVPPTRTFVIDAKYISSLIVFSLAALFATWLSGRERGTTRSLVYARNQLDLKIREINRTNEALQAEITERKRAEERLRVQHTVAQVLAEAATIEEVTPRILRAMGECLGWDVGALWRVDREAEALRCVELWHEASIEIPEFERADWQFTFNPGVGLPGRVWSSRKPAYIPDVVPDKNLPRGPIAEREGLHAAIGFPILLGSEVLGVIEFFSREIKQPDQELLDMVATIGSQIGQFIERKRAEEALMRSKDYLAEAQKLTHTGSWAWDPRTEQVLYCSEEMFHIYGLDPRSSRPSRENFRQQIHPEDREWVKERFEESLRTKIDSYAEYRVLLLDGTVRHISASGHPVLNEDGELIQFVGTAVDVTKRKQAEESLRESEANFAHMNRVSMMGELAASLSHEILHPIATARNNARAGMRFLEMNPPNLDETREALACVVRDTDRAKDIVGRMRDHIKKAPLRKERFDLNSATNEVILLAQSVIRRNGVSVQTRLADGPLPVMGDCVQLQQVLLNLILNAAEAMGSVEEGARELLISTEQDHKGALVAVRDSGPGIDPECLERIFAAFYTTKFNGMGMGLSICRSIVEAHGGRLWAEANEPRGALFQFTLPNASAE